MQTGAFIPVPKPTLHATSHQPREGLSDLSLQSLGYVFHGKRQAFRLRILLLRLHLALLTVHNARMYSLIQSPPPNPTTASSACTPRTHAASGRAVSVPSFRHLPALTPFSSSHFSQSHTPHRACPRMSTGSFRIVIVPGQLLPRTGGHCLCFFCFPSVYFFFYFFLKKYVTRAKGKGKIREREKKKRRTRICQGNRRRVLVAQPPPQRRHRRQRHRPHRPDHHRPEVGRPLARRPAAVAQRVRPEARGCGAVDGGGHSFFWGGKKEKKKKRVGGLLAWGEIREVSCGWDSGCQCLLI